MFVQNPNFLGAVEDLEALAAAAKEAGALTRRRGRRADARACCGRPGECGVDIAVGEGQPLGGRLDFGGPSFGFFCATEEHLRRMPGRIAGETVDVDGRRGFVLALQTREQHIRREKATHNICTSQALNALGGVVYLAWLGKRGIVELGELLVRRTAYARERLAAIDGVELLHEAPVVREFAVRLDAPVAAVLDRVSRGGDRRRLPAGRASTRSTRTACWWRSPSAARREDIDRLADALDGRSRQRMATLRPCGENAPGPGGGRVVSAGTAPSVPTQRRHPDPAAAGARDDDLRALGGGPPRRGSCRQPTSPSARSTS